MRVHVNQLHPDLTVTIVGTESWLDRIYADFPADAGGDRPRITGEITLCMETAGSVFVSGRVHYAPIVSCSRCALGIPWPMTLDLATRFTPPATNLPPARERNLSRAELDVYHFEEEAIDLEALINDMVQTSLPNQMIATTDDGSSCRVCSADLTSPQAYTSEEKTSPFDALKGLKLPH